MTATDAQTEEMGWVGLACGEASSNIQPITSWNPSPGAVSKRLDSSTQLAATTKSVSPSIDQPSALAGSPSEQGRDYYDKKHPAWEGRDGFFYPSYYSVVGGSKGRFTYNAGMEFLSLSMESFLKGIFEEEEEEEEEDDDDDDTLACDLADGLFQALYAAVDEYNQSIQYLDYTCQTVGGLTFHLFVNDWTGYKLLEIKGNVDRDDERPQELRIVGPHSTSSLREQFWAWRQSHPCRGPSLKNKRTTSTTKVKKLTSVLTSHGFAGWSLRRLLYTPIAAVRLSGLVGHLVSK